MKLKREGILHHVKQFGFPSENTVEASNGSHENCGKIKLAF